LLSYKDVFNDPQILPPARAYDHAIPLLPIATPINARPYHYSPMHKTEIEKHVQQLLQAGLIVHSHSPFASLVLLVKKRWQLEILCNTSGVKHALGIANHEHEHHLAFIITCDIMKQWFETCET
jgi:hypothetical protein